MHDQYDVVVVGGGPAGASAAGLLSKRGRRVLLLEKEKFPRYHIGESLIPGVMPVVRELGAAEALADLGSVKKYGITLIWGGQTREPWNIRFDEIPSDHPANEFGEKPHAYEVKRAEFDNMLLTHARRLGATVVEEATVREALFTDGRCTGVRYSPNSSGQAVEVHAPFVIDASGQSKVIGRSLDTVDWHPDLKNLAVWTYFQGGTRYEGEEAGNITVEAHPNGWLWMIPFSDDTCSVGFVAASSEFAESALSPTEIMVQRIDESTAVKGLLAGAVQVAQPRTAKDWSYTCSRLSGPGFLQTGDAAAFIDPLFSTGVMLAMKGGSLAAAAVDRILDEPDSEARLRKDYEREYHSVLDVVISFVRYFYDKSRAVEDYFERAQSLIDPKEERKARQDFILLVSGMARAVESWRLD